MNDNFRNTFRVSNSLDPDQARHFVGPELDPNCWQSLSADNTRRQRIKLSLEELFLSLSNPRLNECFSFFYLISIDSLNKTILL